jgi:FkbM family methyltransferase
VSALGAARRLLLDLRQMAAITDARTMAAYTWQLLRQFPGIARTRSLAPADRSMAERARTCVVDGIRVRLPEGYFPGAREMYARRVYFPNSRVPFGAGATVVDLGANFGLMTALAIAAGARVIAVEAQQGMIAVIEGVADANGGLGRVTAVHAMVGPTTGLAADGKAGLGSHTGAVPPAITMTQLLDMHGVDQVDFLKVDVEGSEFALVAERDWLPRVRRFAMEVHSESGDPTTLENDFRAASFAVESRNPRLQVVTTLGSADGYLYGSRV